MILTPISRDQLPGTLDRFMAGLTERYARRVFQRIRATSRDRAVGGQGERRLAALVFARSFGMSIRFRARARTRHHRSGRGGERCSRVADRARAGRSGGLASRDPLGGVTRPAGARLVY